MKISKQILESGAILNLPKDQYQRRTGKTTGMAMGFISLAMMNPDVDFEVKDHFKTHWSAAGCFNVCVSLVTKLGLKYFEFNKARNTITYRPFVEF